MKTRAVTERGDQLADRRPDGALQLDRSGPHRGPAQDRPDEVRDGDSRRKDEDRRRSGVGVAASAALERLVAGGGDQPEREQPRPEEVDEHGRRGERSGEDDREPEQRGQPADDEESRRGAAFDREDRCARPGRWWCLVGSVVLGRTATLGSPRQSRFEGELREAIGPRPPSALGQNVLRWRGHGARSRCPGCAASPRAAILPVSSMATRQGHDRGGHAARRWPRPACRAARSPCRTRRTATSRARRGGCSSGRPGSAASGRSGR